MTQKNKFGYENAVAYANKHNGFCLSNSYINANTKMEWKCSVDSHPSWFKSLNLITMKKGSWCPNCLKLKNDFSNNQKLLVAKNFAISKGGECLSDIYIKRSDGKMLWKCSNPVHKPWEAYYSNVICHKTWCPDCAIKHKAEDRARLLIELFFNEHFPRKRPSWNINPLTGYKLELDMYSEKLGIAFEYDGKHHDSLNNRIKNIDERRKSFFNVLINDYIKEQNCKKMEVTLYRISHPEGKFNFDKFYLSIKSQLEIQGLDFKLSEYNIEKIKPQLIDI